MTYFLPSPSAWTTTLLIVRRSDHVRERPLGRTEVAQAEAEDDQHDDDRQGEARDVQRHVLAEDRPAEPVDDADHRVQRVEELEVRRDERAGEADRRDE